MQTSTPIAFPQHGWARHRIKPVQRTLSFFDWLTGKKKQKLRASPEAKHALQQKYAKFEKR